jgi:hypothetical protein
MSDNGDRLTSRRAFAAGAGVIAAAIGAAARAQEVLPPTAAPAGPTPAPPTDASGAAPGPPPEATPGAGQPPAMPPPPPNSPARARDLGKLSNILYNNPAERALFLNDPPSYAVRLGLRYISAADLLLLRNAFADGFCCMGCGC